MPGGLHARAIFILFPEFFFDTGFPIFIGDLFDFRNLNHHRSPLEIFCLSCNGIELITRRSGFLYKFIYIHKSFIFTQND